MGPDLPTAYADTGAVDDDDDFNSRCLRTRDDHVTALAARDSGAILPPSLQDTDTDRSASVTSESSSPPVPVEIMTQHRPIAAMMQ